MNIVSRNWHLQYCAFKTLSNSRFNVNHTTNTNGCNPIGITAVDCYSSAVRVCTVV